MNVVILNKSDSIGGAAVVSRRLMDALRQEGVDARMLVCEKLTDSPYVELASGRGKIERKFLLERLKIFVANGFNKKTLFKIDTGSEGLPLWKHPLVKKADAILINWVNQGMLSLNGYRKILKLDKPVIWTMHDMWNMTGICHHAGECEHYTRECGDCPLLGKRKSSGDLSHKIWRKKQSIYFQKTLTRKSCFVAVSNWLAQRGVRSTLLHDSKIRVIPNAFSIDNNFIRGNRKDGVIRLLFGAARLDDPIKGLDTFSEATNVLYDDMKQKGYDVEIVLFGKIKDQKNIEGFSLPVKMLGMLNGEEEVRQAYLNSDILVSASSYETLPGTLVEAQAYGCIPVSFNQGGQADIVENGQTGFLVAYSQDLSTRAKNLARGILKAIEILKDEKKHSAMKNAMRENVKDKFSYSEVARRYIELIESLNE